MQIKYLLLTVIVLFFSFSAISQDLYVPRDVQKAYENNTRAKDGKPGESYWQNSATYNIKLNLAPPNRTIKGSEEINYTNNSPDTLKKLNFKLILNQHKPGAVRLRPAGKDYLTSGLHIDSFKENDTEKKWDDSSDGTNKFIQLNTPLAPNASVTLNIDWHYKVSKQSGREGAIDSTTFFLAYFYPRVAVYDDYSGWDRMTFTGSQEFYNDFNDYTFEVTVPKNYIVWATGTLENPDQVLQPQYADLLEKSMSSDEVIKIATPEDLDKKQITRQNKTNTWKWSANNITDVAIAVSNTYNWDAGSVVVDKKTGRRASVQAAYDSVSTDFEKMVQYGKHSLKWFSNNVPGVPYPYSKSTIIRGFADMEYPMMANDNSHPENPDFTRFVAEHEIAHTYFPFYMGTNETRFGFMDEGWAVTLEYLIGIVDLGKKQATENYKRFRVNSWINDPSFEQDLPIITPTNVLSGRAMGNNEYGKASLGYLALQDLLGEKEFKKALQGYMKRWNGKHPIPWDFFYSFNDITGKNLNWFWKSWFFSNNYIDYAIENVRTQNNNTFIKIKNSGGMPAPFTIDVVKDNGTKKSFHYSPKMWKDVNDAVIVRLEKIENPRSISLNGGIFMDADRSNNEWKK
jgi:hypothetical protein